MNICFYTDFQMSGMTGGIGRVTTVLTDYFRQHYGWKVFSIYAFDAGKECRLTENDGAIRLRLHDRMGFRRSLRSNYSLAADFIRQKEIDIVIVQTSMDVVARLRQALHSIRQDRVKVISVLHYTPGTDEFPIDIKSFWRNLCQGKFVAKDLAKTIIAPLYNIWEHKATVSAYRRAYEYGDAVLLLSDSYIPLYQRFAKLADVSKIIAIPNSVPFEYKMSDSEMDTKRHTCLMVGRMVDYPKRVSLILKMWQHIETHDVANDWQLEIVGDGPDLSSFQNLAKRLDLKHCVFTGRQNPIEFYRHSSLFFMASEFEGFPMTLVEAQQMGCIPIAFDSFGSLKEVITDQINGRIVPEGEVDNYEQAVLTLMQDDSLRRQMARQAIETCKTYSQESICQRWKLFLEQL